MSDLQDYGGPLNPNLKITDLSKGALVRIAIIAGKLYLGMGAFFFDAINEKYGWDTAVELRAWLGTWPLKWNTECIGRR